MTTHRPSRRGLRTAALLSAAFLLALVPVCADDEELSPLAPEIFEFSSPRQGPTWIALQWDSTVQRHDVLYGQLRHNRFPPREWQTIGGIYALGYSVINLQPDTAYQFQVRAHPGDDEQAEPVVSEPITVRTLPAQKRDALSLFIWPQQRLDTFPDSMTDPCLEAHQGKLYVLEAEGSRLWLSRLDPDSLGAVSESPRIEWTRDVSPGIDEPPLPCHHPDMCVFDDKLWITWHVQEGDPKRPQPAGRRQRLAYYDLSAEDGDTPPESYRGLVSAPLQIHPSLPGRGTCDATVSPYLDSLWVAWREVWEDANGPRALIKLARYEPERGQLSEPVTWHGCPSEYPGPPSINAFEGDLLMLFSDRSALAQAPDSEPLMCARFDGKRFYDTYVLRNLGRSFAARGAQLYDRFYFVYQSDAHYPGAADMYYDLALGRLPPRGADLRTFTALFAAGTPYVDDMKYNGTPDIVALGDALFTVCSKRDQPPSDADAPPADDSGADVLAPSTTAPRARGFGAYIGRITRSVREGSMED